MARRSHASRLSDIVMDELAGEQTPWDLDKHLSGCLAGHQTDQSYGAAVYFALEALSGIAHDVAVRANAGKLDADQLDTDWIISPDTNLPVPWIWIRALRAAWERYKTEGGPLEHTISEVFERYYNQAKMIDAVKAYQEILLANPQG